MINALQFSAFIIFLSIGWHTCFSQSLKKEGDRQTGIASFYGKRFNGRKTASGEIFHVDSLTCAHRYLRFGSLVLVTNPKTADSVLVRVNDRGPFVKSRSIDLADSAAKRIGIYAQGLGMVEMKLIRLGPEPNNMSGNIKSGGINVMLIDKRHCLFIPAPLPVFRNTEEILKPDSSPAR